MVITGVAVTAKGLRVPNRRQRTICEVSRPFARLLEQAVVLLRGLPVFAEQEVDHHAPDLLLDAVMGPCLNLNEKWLSPEWLVNGVPEFATGPQATQTGVQP
jgi:hypothetical protein